MKIIILYLSIFLSCLSSAFPEGEEIQKNTISGYIRDASSGEALIGATVFIKETGTGTVTNTYGFYSISLVPGTYNLTVSYIGFTTVNKTEKLNRNIRLNLELQPKAYETKEVIIQAERKDKNISSTEVGRVDVPMEKARVLPAIMGETDILKTIQLLPGVQSAGEGSTGFYVRGGAADQNLILLDEAVVFNTGHLFGFFSVFNPDAVTNTTLIKGGMPANYGGRLSSVVDVSMKEGNNKSYHSAGGIGIISSRLTVEGPIQKDVSSFMISGRRTYIDVLISPFTKNTDFEGNGYYFYDLNTKLNYKFSDKDRLYFGGYFGRDVFSYNSPDGGDFKVDIPWGNATSTLRWNHLFSDKLFMNATAIYNDYHFDFRVKSDQIGLEYYSGIKDVNVKTDFSYFPGSNHKIKFGSQYTYHTFIPSTATFMTPGLEINADNIKKKYAHETGLYFLDEFDISELIKVNAGLRFSTFSIAPPYTELSETEPGKYDTIRYGKGDGMKSYSGFEPRINVRISLNERSSVKLSYNHNFQYIHLVSSSTSTLPTDIWVPSTKMVQPQVGDQYSVGYFRNFFENTIEASVELYYKKMRNLIEYRDGYIETMGRELEWDFVFGAGEAYGAELFINKKYGDLTGWIGYTWSKSIRKFDDLATKIFQSKYDRTHDLSIVATYELNKRVSFGATFVYGTGIATTLPVRRYLLDNTIVNEYMDRNSYRLEPYHRLDISAVVKGKKTKKFQSEWAFSIYNVYNHKNVYFIYFDVEGDPYDGSLKLTAKKVSLFPIIPSVSWNFKF